MILAAAQLPRSSLFPEPAYAQPSEKHCELPNILSMNSFLLKSFLLLAAKKTFGDLKVRLTFTYSRYTEPGFNTAEKEQALKSDRHEFKTWLHNILTLPCNPEEQWL